MKDIEGDLLMPIGEHRAKKSAVLAYSGHKWKAIKNSSWGESHKQNFGEREGYVVCYKNKHGEMVVLSSVIGQPFVNQTEIDANAKLIELAPEMAELIEKFAILNEEYYKDISGFILSARELAAQFNPLSNSFGLGEVPLLET